MRPATGLVAIASLVPLGLTACARKADPHQVEQQIADVVRGRTGLNVDVTCPAAIKVRTGRRYTCRTVLSGAPTDIVIAFTSDDGHFRIAETRPR